MGRLLPVPGPKPHLDVVALLAQSQRHIICLEFAVNNSKFGAAQKVHYQKEYPALLLHERDSYMKMLLIKSDVWAYEQEYRLICPRFTDVKQHPLIMSGNYLSIGPRDLKSIIVGCQASHKSIQTIRGLADECARHVAVRYARRAPNKYGLLIEDWSDPSGD